MQVVSMPIEDIRPYERNPRKNAGAVKKVAASLLEFGWQQPIVVDGETVIIAGHTRWAAAKSLGWTEAPVTVADKLSPEQVKAYRLADNRTNEEASWDKPLLALELNSLDLSGFNLHLTGFDDAELAKLKLGDDDLNPEEQMGADLQYQVVVDCAGEEDQAELLETIRDTGRTCRPLTL